MIIVWMVIIAIMGVLSGVEIGTTMIDTDVEVTNAKQIYQQQIGDEAQPDILIIYEAEVDGVKVYPSVVKEAE